MLSLYLFVSLVLFADSCLCDLSQDKVQRKLKLALNPGCPSDICDENKDIINVAHITADSETDRIHHVWSFVGKPTFLMAISAPNSNLSIDWESFMDFEHDTNRSVRITPEPSFSQIIIIDRIYEFNDPEDKGELDRNIKDKDVVAYNTELFTFSFNKSIDTPNFCELKVHAMQYNESNVGTVQFHVQTYGSYDHGWNYPHLLHNSNGTQVDIVFDRFKVKKSFRAPRLALELAFLTSDAKSSNSSFVLTRRRTLDDEHTPGIFELDTLQAPSSYFEFRPVSYTHVERDVSTSTNTHLGPLINPNDSWYRNSMAFAYFGYLEDHLVQAQNISFGLTNDGFYSKTNYTSFTFLMGLGIPPTEELSKFVVTVALVGVGIPIMLFLVGISCICLKRVRMYRRLLEEQQQ